MAYGKQNTGEISFVLFQQYANAAREKNIHHRFFMDWNGYNGVFNKSAAGCYHTFGLQGLCR